MNLPSTKQNGAALLVALIALIVLTVLGVTTMSDIMNQSTVVRNEQFRQTVFYAASSELNVQIDDVNRNAQSEDDQIINSLLESSWNGENMSLVIDRDSAQPLMTTPENVILQDADITGNRRDAFGCPGESIGKVKVMAGDINVTATLDDGLGSIRSVQTQRYVYCWP